MITIRAATTAQDLAECLRIREEVFVGEQDVPLDMERDRLDSQALHFIHSQTANLWGQRVSC